MKKLALSLAVLFAVGMVSCGGNKDKENCGDTTVTEEVGVMEVAPLGDSAQGDSVVAAGATVAETTTTPEAKDAKADNKEEAKDAKADAAAPAEAAPADGAAAPAAETPAK